MPSVTEVLQQFFFMNGKLNGGHLKPHDIVRHCVSKGIKALNFVLVVGGGNGKLRTGFFLIYICGVAEVLRRTLSSCIRVLLGS